MSLFILIIEVAIIYIIIKVIKDQKHKKESQIAFENLEDFKADNYYLSESSGVSIGFDNQRKKYAFSIKSTIQIFLTTITFCNVKFWKMELQS